MSCEIVCKLRLENNPINNGSNDVELILQSLVKKKPKWHRQCYQHFTNQNKISLQFVIVVFPDDTHLLLLIDCYQINQ